MKVYIIRENETLRYAAEELLKYLFQMDGTVGEILIGDNTGDGIALGLLDDFGLDSHDVDDSMIDDVIDVRVSSLTGYIAGSNVRSVLMGVYNFLKSAGCRWVRPGKSGEYVPQKDMSGHALTYRKKASHPFRGECIEGAVSYEHVRDTIEWLPKVNMNLFMIEQIIPYNYMNRWYRHTGNTKLKNVVEPPYEVYCEYVKRWELLIKKLGLQFHALGHGALNEPFGVRHMISGMHYDVPEETKKAFALVKGKRELFGSSPFFTQLCMSQEWIREKVVKWIADYLEEKPYIDFLHFWLADTVNNHCECEECVKTHPSDFYVQMLNRLDEVLTQRKNNAKIVFIMYTDTRWPPVKERLNNPRRFVLTTAAHRRPGDMYSDRRREGGIPAWKRNEYNSQSGFDAVLSFTDAWKPIFDGPKFLFEYFLYTNHYKDPGYMTCARELARDMKMLPLTGFGGVMSDQTQRCSFPTGLPRSVVGEFQFDGEIDTEEYFNAYFRDAFGADWKAAKDYLETVSNRFCSNALAQNTDVVAQDTGAVDANSEKAGVIGNSALRASFETIDALVDGFAATVAKNCALEDPCHRESWMLLTYHGEYCKRLSKIYVALTNNQIDEANRILDDMIDYLSEVEEVIHPHFDLVLFIQRTRQLIEGK